MFSEPQNIVTQLDLQSGSKVADLGSGSGFYAFAAARAVGDKGKVYAVEVQKDLAARIKNSATKSGLFNVEAVWGDVETPKGTKLADNICDAVIAANLLFQLQDRAGFLAEVKRILKNSGRVLIVDWKDSYGGVGPDAKMVVVSSEAKNLFANAGFKFEKEINAGEHHYGLIFRKV